MKISKDKSTLITGGDIGTSPVKDLAWICIGDGCNPACNTSCTNCITACTNCVGPSCTTNYG